jgi:hypothetical protein
MLVKAADCLLSRLTVEQIPGLTQRSLHYTLLTLFKMSTTLYQKSNFCIPMKLCGLVPSSNIRVSVSDLYNSYLAAAKYAD